MLSEEARQCHVRGPCAVSGSWQTRAGTLAEALPGMGKAGTCLRPRILCFRCVRYPGTESGRLWAQRRLTGLV